MSSVSTTTKLTRPLNVLLVSNTDTSAHIQGADRDCVNLFNALGPERVRVTWAGIRNTVMLSQYLDADLAVRYLDLDLLPFFELFHESMYCHRSTRNWAGIVREQIMASRGSVKALRAALGGERPDIVVTNTSVVLAGAAYARAERVPHIWCVKEFLDPGIPACRRYAWLIERMSNAVVVPSQAISKVFSGRVRVLPDGSDIDTTSRSLAEINRTDVLQSLSLPTGQPVVAQIGAIIRGKGQRVTAAACARLARAGHPPCSVLFLGAGKPGEKAELERIFGEMPDGWGSSMRFVEFGAGDYSYVAAADVVVHPSTLPDPYPNAVREAMILGKPIIGSRVGGIPELVADSETGILIEPNDDEELAAALARLLDSPHARAEMGAAGRRVAYEKFDVQICKNAFYDLLQEVSNQTHPAASTSFQLT